MPIGRVLRLWGDSHHGVPCLPAFAWIPPLCLSPRLLCGGLLAVILSWTSLAADAAAAVVSVGGAGSGLTRTG